MFFLPLFSYDYAPLEKRRHFPHLQKIFLQPLNNLHDTCFNLVTSKFTGPLQNFELSEIRLEQSKGLTKIGNSVIKFDNSLYLVDLWWEWG